MFNRGKMGISSNLKKLRKIHGLNQGELAEELGITQGYYSKLESKDSWLEIDILMKICRYYNIEFKKLIEDSDIIVDKELNKLLMTIKKKELNSSQINTLNDFIKSLK
jgi:transcriptional regulator with XRE-family HTH domain